VFNSIFYGDFNNLESKEWEKKDFLLGWVERPLLRRVGGVNVGGTRVGAA
jgi:hypothetical protein